MRDDIASMLEYQHALSAIRYCDQRLYVISQMIYDYDDILDREYKKWREADEQEKSKIDIFINEIDHCRWMQQHKVSFYSKTKELYIAESKKLKPNNGGKDEPASN